MSVKNGLKGLALAAMLSPGGAAADTTVINLAETSPTEAFAESVAITPVGLATCMARSMAINGFEVSGEDASISMTTSFDAGTGEINRARVNAQTDPVLNGRDIVEGQSLQVTISYLDGGNIEAYFHYQDPANQGQSNGSIIIGPAGNILDVQDNPHGMTDEAEADIGTAGVVAGRCARLGHN